MLGATDRLLLLSVKHGFAEPSSDFQLVGLGSSTNVLLYCLTLLFFNQVTCPESRQELGEARNRFPAIFMESKCLWSSTVRQVAIKITLALCHRYAFEFISRSIYPFHACNVSARQKHKNTGKKMFTKCFLMENGIDKLLILSSSPSATRKSLQRHIHI